MAVVAGATAGALLAFTLPKVASVIGHLNVGSLQSELHLIKAALQDYAESGSATNHLARAWIEDIRDLKDKIEYRTESFQLEVMSPSREEGFFRRTARGAKTQAITRPWYAWQFRKLDRKAKEIHQRHLCYKEDWKSDGASSPAAVSAWIPRQPGIEVGIDKPLNELLKLLAASGTESASEMKMKLKVISIVGYGGIGKTLLADKVYSHENVGRQFAVRARVEAACKDAAEVMQEILQEVRKSKAMSTINTVAPQTDVKDKEVDDEIQEVIWSRYNIKQSIFFFGRELKQLLKGKEVVDELKKPLKGKDVVDELAESSSDIKHHRNGNNDIQEFAGSSSSAKQPLLPFESELKQLLKNERYLIVIDDMQLDELCDLIPHFPSVDGVGSRIIVTTTIQSVAKKCSTDNDLGCLYKLNTLSDADSKKLFLHVLGSDSKANQKELDSSVLLKKCDGLPLALVCTARFIKKRKLKTRSCNEAFRQLCDSGQPDNTLQRMRWQLSSNYESLYSLGLQDLLLYFCMFARDQPVRKRALIRKWLAEDLITLPLDAGPNDNLWDVALDKLEALVDRSIIESVEVSTNGDAKRCQTPGMMLEYISRKSQEQGRNRVRWLSLRPDTAAASLSKDLSHLRTLTVFPGETANCAAHLNFKKYKMLRVLDLKECGNLSNHHLQKICNLLLLKYLSLGKGITKVPEKISKLRLLETLDLRKTEIDSVPVQVIELPGLKHLLGKIQEIEGFRGKSSLDLLLKYSQLETLSGFVTGKSEELLQVMNHMKKLKKVKIWCKAAESGTGDLDGKLKEAIQIFVREGNQEPSPSLSIHLHGLPTVFLDNLVAPGSLASLKLRGNLGRFPLFIPQLNHINELCLAFTNVCGGVILPEADTDTKFQMIRLRYLKLVEEELGPLEIRHKHFPSLERICLVGERSIKGITTGDLKFLESIHMICATLDGVAGIQLERFKNLKEVAILSTVEDEVKKIWQDEALKHPRTPQVWLIPSPNCIVQGTESSTDP